MTTAADMFRAVQDLLPQTDILIKAAAVADYRPATVAQDKMKKSDDALSIPLARTDDILGWVAQHRHPGLFCLRVLHGDPGHGGQLPAKLERKHLDMIVANNLKGRLRASGWRPMWSPSSPGGGAGPAPDGEGPGGRPSAGRDPKTAVGILGPAALGSQNWG